MDDNTHLAPAAYQAFHLRNYQHAIELFERRIEELTHVPDKTGDSFLLENDLAVCYILAGESDKALSLLQNCYDFFKKESNDTKVAMTLANIATAHEKKKEVKEAISYYLQALANFPSFDDNDVKYFIHHNLSLLYMRRLKINKAIIQRFNALEYKQYLTLSDKLIQFVLRVVH